MLIIKQSQQKRALHEGSRGSGKLPPSSQKPRGLGGVCTWELCQSQGARRDRESTEDVMWMGIRHGLLFLNPNGRIMYSVNSRWWIILQRHKYNICCRVRI